MGTPRSAALGLLLTAGLALPSGARIMPETEPVDPVEAPEAELPDGFVEMRDGCTGSIMEPMPHGGGEFWITARKDTLPGLFPVIRHRTRWMSSSALFTLCASKEQISAYASWHEARSKVIRKEIEAEHRGFIGQAANMEYQSLPPEQRTPETRARFLAAIEKMVAEEMVKDDAYARDYPALLRSAVAAMEEHERVTGLPTGPRQP